MTSSCLSCTKSAAIKTNAFESTARARKRKNQKHHQHPANRCHCAVDPLHHKKNTYQNNMFTPKMTRRGGLQRTIVFVCHMSETSVYIWGTYTWQPGIFYFCPTIRQAASHATMLSPSNAWTIHKLSWRWFLLPTSFPVKHWWIVALSYPVFSWVAIFKQYALNEQMATGSARPMKRAAVKNGFREQHSAVRICLKITTSHMPINRCCTFVVLLSCQNIVTIT